MGTNSGSKAPVVRISKGRFAPGNYDRVKRLIDDSAKVLIPAIKGLHGLLYYHASVDPATNTVVNISVWQDMAAAGQMDSIHHGEKLRGTPKIFFSASRSVWCIASSDQNSC